MHARKQSTPLLRCAVLCFAFGFLLLFIFVLNDYYYYFIWNTDFIRLSTIQYGGCLREQHDKYTAKKVKNKKFRFEVSKPDNI